MFVTRLILSDWKPNEWALESLLVWFSPSVSRIEVPEGFITDLASIPRALRAVLNINGKSRKAAVLHDFLYCSQLLPRSDADKLFYDALVCEGMSKTMAHIYWSGVRVGGWMHYRKISGLTQNDFVSKEAYQGYLKQLQQCAAE
jgi:hypothetical protein